MQKGDIFDEIQSLTLIIFLIDFFFLFCIPFSNIKHMSTTDCGWTKAFKSSCRFEKYDLV